MEIKYLLYARKSREDKDAQILSIQSQVEELSEYAKNNSLNAVSLKTESHSAAKQGRPVFNEVLDLIESGQANGLLVWKFDRISRNESDTARVIKLFREGLLEEIRTPFETYKKGDNVLLLYIYFGMADEYSRQLSANVKRGNRTKLKLGQYPAKAPFGFRNYNRDNVKNIEPDENAPIVKMIYEWYASNEYSFVDIKNKLNNELKISSKRGKKFSKSELQKILKNPIYYGIIQRNGELFAGSFTPIITKELYDKVQKLRDNKSRPRAKKYSFAYKMHINCGECGSVLSGYQKTKYYPYTDRSASYTYYACSKKTGQCSQKQISEAKIENQLKQELTKIEFDKEEWKIAVDLLMLDLDKTNEFEHELRIRYSTDIKKLYSKLETLVEMRAGQEITPEEYIAKKNDYTGQVEGLKQKIGELNIHSEKLELVENYAEVIIQAQEILEGDNMEKKRQLVKSISSNLLLLDGTVEIKFKKPFSFYFKNEKQVKPNTMSELVSDVRNYYTQYPTDIPELYLLNRNYSSL